MDNYRAAQGGQSDGAQEDEARERAAEIEQNQREAQDENVCLKAMFDAGVPAHLRGGLMRYLLYRIPPGHFLLAVLSNDLKEAMGRADVDSRAGLFNIVSFLYNNAPSSCWGNPDKVHEWLMDGAEWLPTSWRWSACRSSGWRVAWCS